MYYSLKRNELNKILFRKRLNRRELALGAGISIETINSWMYRGAKATLETVIKVINFLKVNISDVFDEIM